MLHKNPFIEPCLPTLRKEPPTGPLWLHEVKFDGYRIQIHKEGKHVALYSKNGNDFTSRFADMAYAVAHMPTKAVVLDAEITACADDGTPNFSDLLERKDTGLCVWVFDLLSQFGKDARPLSLIARRWMLDKLMARVDIPSPTAEAVLEAAVEAWWPKYFPEDATDGDGPGSRHAPSCKQAATRCL